MTRTRIALTALAGVLALTVVVVLRNWDTLLFAWFIATSPVVPRPASDLLSGLDGRPYAEGRKLIQARLAARFPVGAPEADLAAYLTSQGLKAAPPSPDSQGQRTFSAQWGPAWCGSLVVVVSKSDDEAKLENVGATFGDSGCP
jgi:hypothetical protein